MQWVKAICALSAVLWIGTRLLIQLGGPTRGSSTDMAAIGYSEFFGVVTIVLGVGILGRWAWNKLRKST